jgi:hypothetical protein
MDVRSFTRFDQGRLGAEHSRHQVSEKRRAPAQVVDFVGGRFNVDERLDIAKHCIGLRFERGTQRRRSGTLHLTILAEIR